MTWQLSRLDQVHFDYEASWGDSYDRPWNINLGYSRARAGRVCRCEGTATLSASI